MKIHWVIYVLVLLICILTLFPKQAGYVMSDDCLHWFTGVLLLLLLIIYSIFHSYISRMNSVRIIVGCMSIVLFCCALLSIYGILQYVQIIPLNSRAGVSGGFNNPIGYAASLCMGIPAALLLTCYYHLKKKSYFILLVVLVIICIGIIISGSRTSILCMMVLFIIHYCFDKKNRLNFKRLRWFGGCLPIILIILYSCKQASADGRFFIWRCSLEMINDKPLLGYGSGGFLANYMNYQADYFLHHPKSECVMLADDVQHPFNEYILLLINYGIVGFVLLLVLIYLLWKACKLHPSSLNKSSFGCLAGIAVLSCFSYPLSYPFVWIAGGGSCCILISSADWVRHLSNSWKRNIRFFIIIYSSMSIAFCIWKIEILQEWYQVSQTSLEEQTSETFYKFETLYPYLKNNRLFLYNYAAELNYGAFYEKSLEIASRCNLYWSDYQLQLLMGDNCINLLRYEEAEKHFKKAYNMCPVRFIPLYRLHYIYKKQRNEETADSLARLIIDKPVKVNSTIIRKIKREMSSLCSDICNDF